MGTQVAVKELMCFQDKAKDEVHKRKGRLAKQPAAEDDSGSDRLVGRGSCHLCSNIVPEIVLGFGICV